ncbi:MAG TPA: ABC transporter ATP-binding protein [Acidimicrobiales bacterium]|nr:ABC transporter ATP-binding protein [Acidimicrobiales bacterium]
MKPEPGPSPGQPVEFTPSSISLESVTKTFDGNAALRDLTLEVRAGEFLVLLGPSGCGKTTALRIVAGLEDPSGGIVRIGDEVVNDVDPKDRDIAMVFQSYALYPHLSVEKNIEFPLRARGMSSTERRRLVGDAAASLQLSELLDRKPAQLSGGQRQRVALARAIVRRPRAFLMDEPLSNLDARLRVEMRAELVELHRRLGITILYVTHDQVEAMTMGDRVAILNEGSLQQLDSPEAVYDKPANSFVAGFIGTPPMNVLRGRLELRGASLVAMVAGGELELPPRHAARARQFGEVLIGMRPEDLTIAATGTMRAAVSLVEQVGHERHIGCRLPDGQLIWVRAAPVGPPPRVGDEVGLVAGPVAHLFDPATTLRIDD